MSACCAVSGCGNESFCRSFCKKHYERWRRHRDPDICKKPMAARGEPMRWIVDNSAFNRDDCLIWPFARHPDGRPHMKGGKPTRIMCSMAHGPVPSPLHEAAHSCGKGNQGCISPKHLRWATPTENAADKELHGTVIRGERHWGAKLNESAVREIRRLSAMRTQQSIADQFGVKIMCINKIINRKTWRHIEP